VILCEDISSPDDIESLAARVDESFRAPFTLRAVDVSITASVGMAYAGPGDAVSRQLVLDADMAMYQVKRKGGGAHQLVDLREARETSDRNTLERDLDAAFAHRELDVAYQPIVRSVDGVVTGVEALLRWRHPEKGAISATEMVGIAEDNGLIVRIGEWVLERSCADRRRWRRERPDFPLELAVNVSARQLTAAGFVASVEGILKRTNMDPFALILEVTEGVFIADESRVMTVLADLKALGVRLALDDFGTGFCSLSYLRRFPVDFVKIDKSFVRSIADDAAGATIVTATADLAHVLGLMVIAEGVETVEEREEIVKIGCDYAQGYLYAHPLPAADLISLLASSPDEQLSLPARVIDLT
jgi:EAL domain-containing protein (putative c-di-GMP-specific phosphodiesterase class I)